MRLHINDEFCNSVQQLRIILGCLNNPNVYNDILEYAKSGDMSDWLIEHSEPLVAEKIAELNKEDLSDTAYVSRLLSYFEIGNRIPKPSFKKSFYIGNEDLKIDKDTICISFPVTFIQTINEYYKISIKAGTNECSVDLNPSKFKDGETKSFELSLEKPKEPLFTICIFIDDDVYRTINDLPLYQSELLVCYDNNSEKAILSSNQGDKLFDSFVIVLFTGESFIIVANDKNNKTYFVSAKESKLLCPYSDAKRPSINYTYISNGLGQICVSWQSVYQYYIVNNGKCYPRDEFVFDYCREHQFPYVTLINGFENRIYNLKQWQQSQIDDDINHAIHKVPGIWGKYIGELNGESIFWCVQSGHDGSFSSIIIDSEGKKIDYHPYNGIVVPTWDKKQFIAINRGSKYDMIVFLSTNGNTISRYRTKKSVYPNVLAETKNSIVLSNEISYLKSEQKLVDYKIINSYFYIITGEFWQDDYSIHSTNRKLCKIETDEALSINFNWNGKVENIGNGYIALYDYNNKKYIMSPEGKILLTLSENEDIGLKREYFSYRPSVGKSNTAFIIYCSKTRMHRVFSHKGVLIMEIQCKYDEFVVAYYMRRLYAYSRNEIIFYTPDKERYSIPIGKRRTIKNIEVLSNGYIIVEYERAYDLPNFEMLSMEGNKVCSADVISIFRAE